MSYMEDLLGDPANLAVVMAALALVVALVAVLHYCVERKTMVDRLRRLEAMLAKAAHASSGGGGQSSRGALAAGEDNDPGENPAEEVAGDDPDSLPPGIRFV